MTLDPIKRWGHTVLAVAAILSSLIDWPALARTLVAHPRGARLVAGLLWLTAHLAKSPLDKGVPK